MITEKEVVSAYQYILGRDPETQKAISTHMKHKDVKQLRAKLICSEEFAKKYRELNVPRTKVKVLQEDIENEKIIFLHIPKTGGTTLHSILDKKFKPQDICPERFNDLSNYTAGDLAKYRYFSGHFDYYSTQIIPGHNNRILTIFRKPKDRLVSFYYFQKSHCVEHAEKNELLLPILANKYSFAEFMSCSEISYLPAIYNPYVFLLTGKAPSGEYISEGNNIILNEYDQKLLDEAKAVLKTIFVFGILERYDESMALMLHMLGYPAEKKIEKKMVLSEVVNTVHHKPVEKTPLTPELEKLILDNTYLDEHFYQYATSEFDRLYKEYLNRQRSA